MCVYVCVYISYFISYLYIIYISYLYLYSYISINKCNSTFCFSGEFWLIQCFIPSWNCVSSWTREKPVTVSRLLLLWWEARGLKANWDSVPHFKPPPPKRKRAWSWGEERWAHPFMGSIFSKQKNTGKILKLHKLLWLPSDNTIFYFMSRHIPSL